MSVLGSISAQAFLAEYWQQKPLLIRGACPDYQAPLTADELAGLALEEEIESRLVIESGAGGPWALRHGPFTEQDFAELPSSNWTLLVQALDLWVPDVRPLLELFDFLPPWRVDDIMASYAAPGGSVGPHFDQYDVFLLQVEGARRWQIGPRCSEDTPRVPGTDLNIIRDFEASQEWLLEPGDMLYLPPQISHWGVAETQCMTFSIGFRAPALSDMLGDLAIEISAQGNDRYYTDPALTPMMAGSEIDAAFIAQAKRMLHELIDDDALIGDWFARFMTSPKYPDLQDQTMEQRVAELGSRFYRNGEEVD